MKRINITIKEYKVGNFNSMMNIRQFNTLISGVKLFGEHNVEWMFAITRNNKKFFISNFGKQDFVWRSEYNNYAWGFQLQNRKLIIFTGNKGTSYDHNGGEFLTHNEMEELEELFRDLYK